MVRLTRNFMILSPTALLNNVPHPYYGKTFFHFQQQQQQQQVKYRKMVTSIVQLPKFAVSFVRGVIQLLNSYGGPQPLEPHNIFL